MGTVVIKTLDWFARQRRDEPPGTRHDGVVIILPVTRPERYDEPHLDEVSIFRRALNLRAEQARRAQCAAYTRTDDEPPSAA